MSNNPNILLVSYNQIVPSSSHKSNHPNKPQVTKKISNSCTSLHTSHTNHPKTFSQNHSELELRSTKTRGTQQNNNSSTKYSSNSIQTKNGEYSFRIEASEESHLSESESDLEIIDTTKVGRNKNSNHSTGFTIKIRGGHKEKEKYLRVFLILVCLDKFNLQLCKILYKISIFFLQV